MELSDYKTKIEHHLASLRPALIKEFELFLKGEKYRLVKDMKDLQAITCEYDGDHELVLNSLTKLDFFTETHVLDYKPHKSDLFPTGFLAGIDYDDEVFVERLMDFIRVRFQDWVSDCWLEAKHVNPSVRGFIYEHDIFRGIDLDTKKPIYADEGELDALLASEGIFVP